MQYLDCSGRTLTWFLRCEFKILIVTDYALYKSERIDECIKGPIIGPWERNFWKSPDKFRHFFHALREKKSTIFFSVAFKISDLNILAGLEATTNLNKFCTR